MRGGRGENHEIQTTCFYYTTCWHGYKFIEALKSDKIEFHLVIHPWLENDALFADLILPALTLGIRPLSVVLQLARNSMLDVLSQDYIRTARAKGLSFYLVLKKHALKNALNPVITAVSGWLASMMAGVVFVEYIFGWKGLGYVIVEGVNNYDIPVVMGVVLFISLFFILITLFVDLIYVLLDPRVKLQ